MQTKSALFISILNKQNKSRELFFPARLSRDLDCQRAFESQQEGNISSLWVGRSRILSFIYTLDIHVETIPQDSALYRNWLALYKNNSSGWWDKICITRVCTETAIGCRKQKQCRASLQFKNFNYSVSCKIQANQNTVRFCFTFLPSSLSSLKWMGGGGDAGREFRSIPPHPGVP